MTTNSDLSELRVAVTGGTAGLGLALVKRLAAAGARVAFVARTARDVELNGQHLRKNDRVVISWLSANHDEQEFDRPDEIILDRTPNRHLAFGLGPHRCIGSHLARLMSEVMVRAVLDRIPDYEVDQSGVYQYLGNPSMTGLGKLPVTFTTGAKRG